MDKRLEEIEARVKQGGKCLSYHTDVEALKYLLSRVKAAEKRAEAAERFIRESEGCIECMQSYRDKEEFLHCKLYVKNIACENFDKWKWRGYGEKR